MRKRTLTLPNWLGISLEDNPWDTVFEPGLTVYFPGMSPFDILPPGHTRDSWCLPEELSEVRSTRNWVRVSSPKWGEFKVQAVRESITVAGAVFDAIRAYEVLGRQATIEQAVIVPSKISRRMIRGISGGMLQTPIPFSPMIHLYLSAKAVESRIEGHPTGMKSLADQCWDQVDPIVSEFETTRKDPVELVEAYHWDEPKWLFEAAAEKLRKLYREYDDTKDDAEYVFKKVVTKIS